MRDAMVERTASLSFGNGEGVRLKKDAGEHEGQSTTTILTLPVRELLERERKPVVNEERVKYRLRKRDELCAKADPERLAKHPFEDLYDDEPVVPK